MGDDTSESTGETLSLDACLEILANRQRRVIFGFVLDSETDHASVETIISKIIEDEVDRTGKRPGHDSVSSTLFHVHLPKFADAGILTYDPRHLEVRYHEHPRLETLYTMIQDL